MANSFYAIAANAVTLTGLSATNLWQDPYPSQYIESGQVLLRMDGAKKDVGFGKVIWTFGGPNAIELWDIFADLLATLPSVTCYITTAVNATYDYGAGALQWEFRNFEVILYRPEQLKRYHEWRTEELEVQFRIIQEV